MNILKGIELNFGLYIHFPFCLSKCYYCSFNSILYDPSSAGQYVSSLKNEMRLRTEKHNLNNIPLKTIYFGGGTPSILSPLILKDIIDLCKTLFGVREETEITIEANPETLTLQKLEGFRSAGINRISIGAQTFSDKHLKALGRIHDAGRTKNIFAFCREAGFQNIGLDLIYALPDQSTDEWVYSLNEAVSLNPQHISIYSLSLDKGTILEKRYMAGEINLPSQEVQEEVQIEMYLKSLAILKDAGYIHYEISNFAKAGYECGHNLLYWDRDNYLGIGAGAHSFIRDMSFSNTGSVEKYVSQIQAGCLKSKEETLSRNSLITDAIAFGLRKIDGVDLREIDRRFEINSLLLFEPAVTKLVNEDLMIFSEGKIKLTDKGILFADFAASEFWGREENFL